MQAPTDRTASPRRLVAPRARARAALAAAAVAGVLFAPAAARAEADEPAALTRILDDMSSEAAAVRERAAERLEAKDDLTADELRRALAPGTPRSRPLLYRIAAARGMKELVPDLARGAALPDALAAEAAIRALVAFGADAVAAGREALAAAPETVVPLRDRTARLRHLQALAVQRRVEHEVLSKWRRKGGSYRGRYASLGAAGWDAQPVLLAMLLDVPLEDQFVVVPATGDEDVDRQARVEALRAIASSRRRGYRTFDPLPVNIEPNDVFDLAAQALTDVADLTLMGPILLDTQVHLKDAHDRAAGVFRPRQFEDIFARDIEIILAARGAPTFLEDRLRGLQEKVDQYRRWIRRLDPEDAPEQFRFYALELADLASVLHQIERFDEAAERYANVVEIKRLITGKDPSIDCYNCACSLARGGRADEAFAMLARSLDPAESSGSDDLTREWVAEDGDLESLHDDPRFRALLDRRFGPPVGGVRAPESAPGPSKR